MGNHIIAHSTLKLKIKNMRFDLPYNENKTDKLSSIKFRLFMAPLSAVDIDNFPKGIGPNGATINTNVLMPNQVYHFIDARVNSINPNTAPGDSPEKGVLTLSPIIEGISKASLSWFYDNLGKRVIAIWERCEDGQKFIGGNPCSAGLQIGFASIGSQDEGYDGIALTLTGGQCTEPFYFYDGDIPREAPFIVTLGGGTTFALQAASQYLMTDNIASVTLTDITGVTNADIGRIIELQGAGVNFPTIIKSSDKFILNNGLQFSASVGHLISFQIVKTGDETYTFHEVFRS